MATLSWIGTSGGDWQTAANWQGGTVPTAADDAVLNLAQAETITVSTLQHAHSVTMADTAATFVVTGTLDATGDIRLSFGTIALDGTLSSGGTIALTSPNILSFSGTGAVIASGAVELSGGSTPAAGTISGVTVTDPGSITVTPAACFAAGTHIATPDGETRVEALAVGDTVRLGNGNTAPVTWIGHRDIDFRRHPNPAGMYPVRVRRGAFADNVPHRDLILSPDHAIHCEGVLIPVRHLINGRNVVQEAWDRVTWFHIELPQHDIVFAEGLPAESYLETGGRDFFANGDGVVRLTPAFLPSDQGFVMREWEARGYAPLVVTGPVLERTRHALLQRVRTPVPARSSGRMRQATG